MSLPQPAANFEVFAKDLWAPFLAISSLASQDTSPSSPDERLIRDLLTEYCYCYDAGDIERTVALFTADATISNAAGIHKGTEAIRRNYVDFVSKRRFGFHFITNLTIRIVEAQREAVAACYLVTLNMTNAGQIALVAGSYVDRLVKTGGAWKISERRITPDIRSTLAPDR